MHSPVYLSLLTLLISAATVNSQTSKECDTSGIYLINTAVDCGIFGTSDMHHMTVAMKACFCTAANFDLMKKVDAGCIGTIVSIYLVGCGGTQATHTWPGTALTVAAATDAATTQVTRSVVALSAIPTSVARTGTSSAFSAAPAALLAANRSTPPLNRICFLFPRNIEFCLLFFKYTYTSLIRETKERIHVLNEVIHT